MLDVKDLYESRGNMTGGYRLQPGEWLERMLIERANPVCCEGDVPPRRPHLESKPRHYGRRTQELRD